MCGRYVSAKSASELHARFDAVDETGGQLRADFNVAPTKPVPAVLEERGPTEPDRPGGERGEGRRRLRLLRWGLVPFWAKDPKVGSRMINARIETVAEKPAYRRALAARRCLLPADGYYEWLPPEEPGGRKQPVYLSRADGQPLALAGLWETWASPDGQRLDSSVVLTTTAVDELGHVHDRAPVVVDEPDWAAWLNPDLRDPEQVSVLLARLGPLPAAATAAWPVSMDVNSVRNNGPQLREPLPQPA